MELACPRRWLARENLSKAAGREDHYVSPRMISATANKADRAAILAAENAS